VTHRRGGATRPRPRTLTTADWCIINSALALYACEPTDDGVDDAHEEMCEATRAKVCDRITQADIDRFSYIGNHEAIAREQARARRGL
jgi:hypothetical protein